MPRTSSLILALAVVSAGCAHTPPPTAESGAPEGPFQEGSPLRLTWSGSGGRGSDAPPVSFGNRSPSWRPEAGTVAYAYGGYSNDGPDGCVGGLPSGGGARVWELCDTDASRRDTITTADWPAERRDGAVALVRRRWSPIGRTPYYSELALRPAGDGQAAARVLPIPYPAPGAGVPVQGVAFPAWLDDHRLLVLAQVWMRSLYDNVDTGLEIEILDLTLGTSGVTTVPGTLYASSVAPGATPDTIYYTLGGDSLVYRRALSSGVVDTVVDFGALGIARDVQVRNGRLVAVVGGSVTAGAHPYLGYAQYDGGGPLYLVTLGTGQPTLVESVNDRWKHPTLDPAGTAVIAEQGGDLWRIPLP